MKRNKNIKTNWELMGKSLTSEATPAEREALEKWASASKKNSLRLEETKFLLQKTDELYQLKRFDTESAWQKTVHRTTLSNTSVNPIFTTKQRFINASYKYAAILVITLLLGALAYYIVTRPMALSNRQEIASSYQEAVKELRLPDGSSVTLNHNSTLQYPAKFDPDRREVILTGEAFFDVLSDPDRPFIIRAGDAEVKVLGTAFNISAYPDDEVVEVVVETGAVSVTCSLHEASDAKSEVLLQAGERAVLLNTEKKLEKSTNKNSNYLAWKTGQLVFENTPMEDVIRQLTKTYHTTIKTGDEQLNHLLLTARFDDKPVEFILEVIQLTFDLQLAEQDGVYFLSKTETLNK